jgi:hypothetical protein
MFHFGGDLKLEPKPLHQVRGYSITNRSLPLYHEALTTPSKPLGQPLPPMVSKNT